MQMMLYSRNMQQNYRKPWVIWRSIAQNEIKGELLEDKVNCIWK